MIEILGGDGIENAFLALGVTAFKYDRLSSQVQQNQRKNL